ncbi:MAG: uroporphyrinogen-III synthase [Pseudolabrys sp.]|nr:uroporphyrinogen-III synthase [Pseudolabrys sp.]MBV9956151.1 uroporphyrinogen-III synthase [Pseudolabrys sp.]
MSGGHIVVTRPLPDGERTASALRAKGFGVVIAPLLRIEPVAAELAGQWSGVVVSSANAARALSAHRHRSALLGLRVFAVGEHTAAAARQAGFGDVLVGGGDAQALVGTITSHVKSAAPLLYLAGEERAADLGAALAAHDIGVTTAVIYRAARLAFPAALLEALQTGAAGTVLHYSRRTAESYLAGARAAGVTNAALALRHLCLSEAIAQPLLAAGAADVAFAARPDEAALFALL